MNAKVIAATRHLKKEICIGVREISLINSPPLLHKIAAIKTASNPF
jgi:hypothetical protein